MTAEFLNAVPGEPVELTASDGVHLVGIVYEHTASGDASTPASSKAPSASDVSAPTDSQASSDAIDSSTIDPALLDEASPSDTAISPDNRWVIVVHGYRDTNQSGYVLDMVQHYYDAGFNVLTPDLRASSQSEGDYVGMGWLDRLDTCDWIDQFLRQDIGAQIVIHGTADDFIPFDMMGQLYDAKVTGDKEQLVSEGAGHAEAMYELSDVYWDTVFGFVNRYVA